MYEAFLFLTTRHAGLCVWYLDGLSATQKKIDLPATETFAENLARCMAVPTMTNVHACSWILILETIVIPYILDMKDITYFKNA